MRYAVIMAGGAGTRLWPMSRTGKPKQLLRFIGGQSLLQIAAGRLRGLVDPKNVYVCTGAAYTQQVLDDLPLLPDSQLLGEPILSYDEWALVWSALIEYSAHRPGLNMKSDMKDLIMKVRSFIPDHQTSEHDG